MGNEPQAVPDEETLSKQTQRIAHDFNNILGAILGYAGLLREQLGEHPHWARLADDVLRAGERASRLSQELALLSGALKPVPAPAEVDGGFAAVVTILVVDDDEALRHLFAINLDRLGYRTLLASSGEEAIDLYREALADRFTPGVDAVLMDLYLDGGVDGKEAAAVILSLDADARIAVCSGDELAPEVRNFGAFGFRAALPKDFDIPRLKLVLEQLVGRSA